MGVRIDVCPRCEHRNRNRYWCFVCGYLFPDIAQDKKVKQAWLRDQERRALKDGIVMDEYGKAIRKITGR